MVLLLVVSIVLQLMAGALCCWHMRETRAAAGWGLLLAALVLTAVYRGLLLDGVLAGDVSALGPAAESVSLFASGLLVAGLIWLRPFFTASSQAEQAIRESAERLQLVMNSALDAVVGMNASGHVTDWNAQAEAIFGWTRQQAVGRELSELVIPEPYRAAHRYGLRRYVDTGEAPILNRRVELTALSRDGREFPVELTVVPACSGDAPFFTAFVRDITDRKRAERQLARQALESRLLHQATMLASETDSFEDALRCCIDFVGELTRWPVGQVYLPDAGRGTLIAAGIWHLEAPERFHEFRTAVESMSFAPGVGLPGRVWSAGEPVWLPNLEHEENFPRKDLCARVGLNSAFGFPITIRGETAAVIEFFAADATPLDPELLMTVRTLGEQVGRVIERKRAAEDLRASESRFRSLVEQAPVVIQIFAPDGSVLAANQAWEELWGSPRSELPGYNILMDPQLEAKGVRPEIRRAFAGEAVALPPVLYDPVETGNLGRKRWVEAFFYPVRDGDRITEVVLMLRDVTERIQVEEELRESERRFRRMADTAPVLIWMSDTQKENVYVNQRWLEFTGRLLEEELGDRWMEVVHPDDLPKLKACASAFQELTGFTTQFRLRRADGEYRWMLDTGVPRFTPGGDFAGYIGSCVDIHDQKRTEQALRESESRLQTINRELQQTNQEMEQFVYSVSHDLKSPLVTMTGFLGMLREDLAAGRTDDLPDSLGRIERATSRMGRLIEDLLQLSRAGRVRDELEEIDVTALVRDLAEELSGRLEATGAKLSIEPDMPHVIADRARLLAVFDNLLNNALKYGANGAAPRISVGAAIIEGRTRYFVRDNGPGIPARFHARIFGLFQRLGSQHEGTGVGLAIVARVMEVHGGRAWVESTPGQGATFWIEFPAEPVRAVPQRDGPVELVEQ